MTQNTHNRNRDIIRINLLGIGMNLLLSVFKLILGYLANAHAVILDGFNSLSDLISSLLSIICTTIGGKKADNNHPFGYGRLEYLSSMVITLIIMYIGLQSLIDSVKAILNPHDAPHYSPLLICIMSISLVLKLCYGWFARRRGKSLDSAALIMTGTDSMGDAVIALAVLAGIVVYKILGLDIENYLCIGISLMILYSGVNVMRDCLNKMLGTGIEPEFRKQIIGILTAEDEVLNVSNLVIHDYGEGIRIGSVDIEVRGLLRASQISELTRALKQRAGEAGVTLTSVGISAIDPDSSEDTELWDCIIETALKYRSILRVQAYSCSREKKQVSFDVVLDNSGTGQNTELEQFKKELDQLRPDIDYQIHTAINMGYSTRPAGTRAAAI